MSDATAAYSKETAKILLDIKAVNFRPEEPYILTSGWASPVYIDCRKIISFPEERARIIGMAVEQLNDAIGFDNIDVVAGGETAGIPYGAWIAEAAKKPMVYVRKKPKGFGRNAQIEGREIKDGERVLLVEDLATDGASKITFVDALKAVGATVTDTWVVFFYGAFPGGLETLSQAGVTLHHLAQWRDVLDVAAAEQRFPEAAIEGVRAFLDDPISWSLAHGGKGA